MEMDALWSIALTFGLGLMGWLLRSAYAEVQRISILLKIRLRAGSGVMYHRVILKLLLLTRLMQ